MKLEIGIRKKLKEFVLEAEFAIDNGCTGLMGPSGSGKSMTLKCIAGIERPDRGRIVVDGTSVFDSEKGINVSPQQRRVGVVFQNYALFPHMTVRQNIWAGAWRENSKEKRMALVEEAMERFGLTDQARHYPHQLSGGQ